MSASGARIKQMAMASFGMPTVMFMKDPGPMTKQMDRASTPIKMVQSMKVTGSTIFRTELVLRPGPMEANTRVLTKRA